MGVLADHGNWLAIRGQIARGIIGASSSARSSTGNPPAGALLLCEEAPPHAFLLIVALAPSTHAGHSVRVALRACCAARPDGPDLSASTRHAAQARPRIHVG